MTEPRTEAGKRLLDHPMDKTWTLGAILAIEAKAAAPRAATEPDYLDGARDAYQDELRVRRLLTYLWNATGYRSENLRVRDMFADDDPLVADVEAALLAGDKAEAPE